MFGAGLPVLAAGFAALPELVAHGANGLVFNSPQELAQQLAEVLSGLGAARKKKEASESGRRSGSGGFRRRSSSSSSTSGPPLLAEIPGGALGYGDEPRLLASLRSTVASTRAGGWEASWGRTVAPLFGGVKG